MTERSSASAPRGISQDRYSTGTTTRLTGGRGLMSHDAGEAGGVHSDETLGGLTHSTAVESSGGMIRMIVP